jgi:hypothetical protein
MAVAETNRSMRLWSSFLEYAACPNTSLGMVDGAVPSMILRA